MMHERYVGYENTTIFIDSTNCFYQRAGRLGHFSKSFSAIKILNKMGIKQKTKKLIILADLKDILNMLDKEEITMSRAAELLNIAANERYLEYIIKEDKIK
jgi:hypothetical protein